MKFQNNFCPLCAKSLRLRSVAGVNVYECPTTLPGLPAASNASHYIVEQDFKFEIQHMIVLPYSVDTYADATRSRIYKLADGKWRLLQEVPYLKADLEEKLLERIQKLLVFS